MNNFIVATTLMFLIPATISADTIELSAKLNVVHQISEGVCISWCDGTPDTNPQHTYSLVLSWTPVPNAQQYSIWSDPGDWGCVVVDGSITQIDVTSLGPLLDHLYSWDYYTNICSDVPYFIPMLFGNLESFHAIPDVFHVEAQFDGQEPIESAPVDGGGLPKGPVFLVPGMSLMDDSQDYAFNQFQNIINALSEDPDHWLGDEGFVLEEDMFVVNNFDPSLPQEEKALLLQQFIEGTLANIGYQGDSIRIIGYSEGGRVTRAYNNLDNGIRVRNIESFVSVASPHNGSFWADLVFSPGKEKITGLIAGAESPPTCWSIEQLLDLKPA